MTKGERIKALREAAGMSQTKMASRINVSKQTLYKYENDIVTNIPSDKIEAIAEVTGTTPAFIMGWQGADNHRSGKGQPDPDILYFENVLSGLTAQEKKELLTYADYLISKRS